MPDFNWINAVPVRDWSVPDRGWSVLTVGQRDFSRKSNLQRGDDAAALFAAWAMQQVHRNYTLLLDELDNGTGHVVIAMRSNPAVRDLRLRPARYWRKRM